MTSRDAEATVQQFWRHMDARDYTQAGALLTQDCLVDWPNTHERMNRDQWIRVNAEYPGAWAAVIEQVVATDTVVVSATRVFARSAPDPVFYVVSFFRFRTGRICALTEYWSECVLDAPLSAERVAAGLSQAY